VSKPPSVESFLRSLRAAFGAQEAPEPPADPIDEFVWSFLLWEATPTKATHALRRIRAETVDFNEFRVSLPGEIRAMLGERYPLVDVRAVRLRAALDDIYRREHAVSLTRLTAMPKRESRAYLDSIEATPPYVAARVQLMALGGHAVPLDQRTLGLLVEAGLFGDTAPTLEAATATLSRAIKAEDAAEAHLLLTAWAEAGGGPVSRSGRRAKTSSRARSTTTKKKKKTSASPRPRKKG